jgi:hypothetical protein
LEQAPSCHRYLYEKAALYANAWNSVINRAQMKPTNTAGLPMQVKH